MWVLDGEGRAINLAHVRRLYVGYVDGSCVQAEFSVSEADDDPVIYRPTSDELKLKGEGTCRSFINAVAAAMNARTAMNAQAAARFAESIPL